MSTNTNQSHRPNWQAQIARERGSKARRESEREERRELLQQTQRELSTMKPRPEGIERPMRVPYVRPGSSQ